MKITGDQGHRSYRPPLLMVVVLGIHVVAIGSFMMMSGCATKRHAAVEPPPAPVLAPGSAQPETPPGVVMPRPTIRPPMHVSQAPDTMDAGATYTVQKGDSLSKIAVRAGVTVRELADLNNIANQNQIRIGQKLLLPAHAKSLPDVPAPAPAPVVKPAAKPASQPAAPAVASGNTHVVQSGDTLGKLAVRYGTTVAAFKSVNNLKSDLIRIGQKLSIPQAGGTQASAPTAPAPAPAPVAIAPAPAIIAPAPAAAVPTAVIEPDTESVDFNDETPFPYTVKEGDTLESIALKFSAKKDVIMRLNNLTSENVRPNQKLLIPWN